MRAAWIAVALGALSAGCDHSVAPTYTPEQRGPLGAGNPVQVTYNPGADRRPAWLPDGSGYFYTRERLDRSDSDHCLGLLPAAGGVLRTEICEHSLTDSDSMQTFESAAAASDGRLAYVRAATSILPPSIAPATAEIRLGTLTRPQGAIVRTLPFVAPSGRSYQTVEWLQWLSASELVFLGEEVVYFRLCGSCPVDTLRNGLEVARIDPTIGVASVIPGTDFATSLAAVPGDSIYFTVAGEFNVRRKAISGGTPTSSYDFSSVGVPRDLSVASGRLVAVTGPGLLWLVQLSSGAITPLGQTRFILFKRPALSPNGSRLVVEGYPFTVDTIRIPGVPGIAGLDTIVDLTGDLWLFDLP